MTTIQITLNVENDIADKVKEYTDSKHIALNSLLENYLYDVAQNQVNNTIKAESVQNEKGLKDFPEWIQKLTISKTPTEDFDHKKEYGDHIMRKYGA